MLSIGGKVYPYTYTYSYAEVSQNTLVIESDSYEDSPCKVTIFAPSISSPLESSVSRTGTR